MIGPTGRFTALRGFAADGHAFAAGDPLDTDHAELIRLLLESGKIEARDDQTRKRIAWRAQAQWTPSTRRERGQVYDPANWG